MIDAALPHVIGLDVVDLSDARSAGKAGDARFVRRVFTETEARRIASSPDPDLALWIHWAAKEAAFKAETCASGTPPVFVHSEFEFVSADPMPPRSQGSDLTWSPSVTGTILRPEGRYRVSASVSGAVLALAEPHRDPPAEDGAAIEVRAASTEAVLDRLGLPDLDEARRRTDLHPEVTRAHSPASAAVRLALRSDLRDALARRGDPHARHLVVVTPEGPIGRTPPHVEDPEGIRKDVAISISHHGRHVAWAWRLRG